MANLPYEVFKELEESLGKERAERLTRAFEKYFETQKEELKAQLKEEMRSELLTKGEFYSEIKRLEERIESLEKTIDLKLKLWFLILIALILFTNRGTLEWFLKVVGLLR